MNNKIGIIFLGLFVLSGCASLSVNRDNLPIFGKWKSDQVSVIAGVETSYELEFSAKQYGLITHCRFASGEQLDATLSVPAQFTEATYEILQDGVQTAQGVSAAVPTMGTTASKKRSRKKGKSKKSKVLPPPSEVVKCSSQLNRRKEPYRIDEGHLYISGPQGEGELSFSKEDTKK